jgi:sn-glycerol 3-phosphate transport system ATP-binding protein
MNFLAGRIAEGGVVELDDGARLPVPAGVASAGRAVAVGLRPEHVALDGAAASLQLTVELIEMLGADTIVHGTLRQGGALVLARLPGTVRIAVGERVPLAIPRQHVHLFDAATGTRL